MHYSKDDVIPDSSLTRRVDNDGVYVLCTSCGKRKPMSHFRGGKRPSRMRTCRSCKNAYNRVWKRNKRLQNGQLTRDQVHRKYFLIKGEVCELFVVNGWSHQLIAEHLGVGKKFVSQTIAAYLGDGTPVTMTITPDADG